MSNVQKTFLVAGLVAAATVACSAAWATDEAECPSVTKVQRSIVEHADQGMDQLRSHVWQTHIMYGIGMPEVKASIDGWREAVNCQLRVARAAAKVEVAMQATDAPGR